MMTLQEYGRLTNRYGAVTHFVFREGCKWYSAPIATRHRKAPLHSYVSMHALRFEDGTEWDEVNGVRERAATIWTPR